MTILYDISHSSHIKHIYKSSDCTKYKYYLCTYIAYNFDIYIILLSCVGCLFYAVFSAVTYFTKCFVYLLIIY